MTDQDVNFCKRNCLIIIYTIYYCSVSDPYSFYPDPDPIRIQGFNDQKLKKITAEKFFLFFWSKTAIYLSLGLHKVCSSNRRSLQLTKEAIQNFKTWIFSTFVGHFCHPGSGSGFRIRIRIRIHWPDWIRIQSGSETLYYWGYQC